MLRFSPLCDVCKEARLYIKKKKKRRRAIRTRHKKKAKKRRTISRVYILYTYRYTCARGGGKQLRYVESYIHFAPKGERAREHTTVQGLKSPDAYIYIFSTGGDHRSCFFLPSVFFFFFFFSLQYICVLIMMRRKPAVVEEIFGWSAPQYRGAGDESLLYR